MRQPSILAWSAAAALSFCAADAVLAQPPKPGAPAYEVDEASRWDYRIEIAYKDIDGSKHEEEIAQELFKDSATRKREENRRWELTVNHWDLPIYQVDTTKAR